MAPPKLRLVLAGTPAFAATIFEPLFTLFEVIAVFTQPDRRSQRNQQVTISAVKKLALSKKTPLYQPEDINACAPILKTLAPDLMLVIAYGQRLSPTLLNIPHCGCVNVHASLLPKWRGSAPIQRALENGDQQTGITFIKMSNELDKGDIIRQYPLPIHHEDNYQTLYQQLAQLAKQQLPTVLGNIHSHQPLVGTPQQHALASYAKKVSKHEYLINWQQPAHLIAAHIRAFYPYSYSHLQNKLLKILHAQPNSQHSKYPPATIIAVNDDALHVQCNKSSLAIDKLQLAGKKPQPFSALYHGYPAMFQVGAGWH